MIVKFCKEDKVIWVFVVKVKSKINKFKKNIMKKLRNNNNKNLNNMNK